MHKIPGFQQETFLIELYICVQRNASLMVCLICGLQSTRSLYFMKFWVLASENNIFSVTICCAPVSFFFFGRVISFRFDPKKTKKLYPVAKSENGGGENLSKSKSVQKKPYQVRPSFPYKQYSSSCNMF